MPSAKSINPPDDVSTQQLEPSIQDAEILRESFKRYKSQIILAVVFSLLASLAEVLSIGALIPFLQNFTSEEAFTTGIRWVDVHILGVEASTLSRMYRVCGLILVATWFRSLFGYMNRVYVAKSHSYVVEDLRMRVVDQLQAVSLSFYSKMKGGEILNSIMTEINRTTAMLGTLFSSVTQITLFAFYIGLMVLISWKLTLLVLGSLGILALGLTGIVRSVREEGKRVTAASGNFTSVITEYISGVRTVIAYNKQERERERLQSVANELAEAGVESVKRQGAIQPVSQAVVGTVMIVLLVVAVQFFVLSGELDMAFVLAFLLALLRMMPVVHQLNVHRGAWAKNRAGLTNVAEILRTDNKPYLSEGDRIATPLREAIVFEDVDFAYDEGGMVLKDINIEIPKSMMTAIVGASGAGKSTLVDLIPRFHDPTNGRILWDGVDLREFKVRSLRERIAIVSQATHIFNDTVYANIAYGVDNASREAVIKAAREANALEFIEEMENGFDTALGDRGVRLSGGQRQRLAIARAILCDPEILILDEATSDLDSISEKLVQQSLERLMEGRTVIAIAHRLSTLENAHNVIVMEEGKVVEQGQYDELLEQKGQLWKYHSIQFQMA